MVRGGTGTRGLDRLPGEEKMGYQAYLLFLGLSYPWQSVFPQTNEQCLTPTSNHHRTCRYMCKAFTFYLWK